MVDAEQGFVTIRLPKFGDCDLGNNHSEALGFLKRLHDQLLPLIQYKLPTGFAAIQIDLRDGRSSACILGQTAFGEEEDRDADALRDHEKRGWWVCTITSENHLGRENELPEICSSLYSLDFDGDAPIVCELFQKVCTYVGKHATVPAGIPERMSKALEALR